MNGGCYYFDCGRIGTEDDPLLVTTPPEKCRELMEAIKAGKSVHFSFSVKMPLTDAIEFTPSLQLNWSARQGQEAFKSNIFQLSTSAGDLKMQFVATTDEVIFYIIT